jgi:predicted transcriptional regulator
MTNIEIISVLGTLLSKKYGKDLFKLLKVYNDISASEASSRLGLHVQTVQEFLESAVSIGLSEKREVVEKKRPYYRYSLIRDELDLKFDIKELVEKSEIDELKNNSILIREMKNSNSHFTVARSGNFFSTISVMEGLGRTRKQKRINLTNSQGKFLFHLPFPDARPLTIENIMSEALIDKENQPEIEDIVMELIDLDVIEKID